MQVGVCLSYLIDANNGKDIEHEDCHKERRLVHFYYQIKSNKIENN